MSTIHCLNLLALTALLGACAGEEEASDLPWEADTGFADDGMTERGPSTDACRTVGADASATLSAADDEDALASGRFSYWTKTGGCQKFVADFRVLPDASPADGFGVDWFDVEGRAAADYTGASCDQLRSWVRVYEKPAGASSFTLSSSTAWRGRWYPGAPGGFSVCEIELLSGTPFASNEPNPAGTDTYRVAASARVGTVYKPVEARIGFQIVPH